MIADYKDAAVHTGSLSPLPGAAMRLALCRLRLSLSPLPGAAERLAQRAYPAWQAQPQLWAPARRRVTRDLARLQQDLRQRGARGARAQLSS